MRHFLANIATYGVAILLLAGALAFAWIRSEQVVLSREAVVAVSQAATESGEFRWQELGSSSYRRNCAACHGTGGEGWDQYPGLGGSARFLSTVQGREYLLDLHIYGLSSPRWRAPMPPMEHLPDAELAAVVNYIVAHFGGGSKIEPNAELFTAEDIRERRGQGLRPEEVAARRPQ